MLFGCWSRRDSILLHLQIRACQVYCYVDDNGEGWMLALNIDTSDGNVVHYSNVDFWESSTAVRLCTLFCVVGWTQQFFATALRFVRWVRSWAEPSNITPRLSSKTTKICSFCVPPDDYRHSHRRHETPHSHFLHWHSQVRFRRVRRDEANDRRSRRRRRCPVGESWLAVLEFGRRTAFGGTFGAPKRTPNPLPPPSVSADEFLQSDSCH